VVVVMVGGRSGRPRRLGKLAPPNCRATAEGAAVWFVLTGRAARRPAWVLQCLCDFVGVWLLAARAAAEGREGISTGGSWLAGNSRFRVPALEGVGNLGQCVRVL